MHYPDRSTGSEGYDERCAPSYPLNEVPPPEEALLPYRYAPWTSSRQVATSRGANGRSVMDKHRPAQLARPSQSLGASPNIAASTNRQGAFSIEISYGSPPKLRPAPPSTSMS